MWPLKQWGHRVGAWSTRTDVLLGRDTREIGMCSPSVVWTVIGHHQHWTPQTSGTQSSESWDWYGDPWGGGPVGSAWACLIALDFGGWGHDIPECQRMGTGELEGGLIQASQQVAYTQPAPALVAWGRRGPLAFLQFQLCQCLWCSDYQI